MAAVGGVLVSGGAHPWWGRSVNAMLVALAIAVIAALPPDAF